MASSDSDRLSVLFNEAPIVVYRSIDVRPWRTLTRLAFVPLRSNASSVPLVHRATR